MRFPSSNSLSSPRSQHRLVTASADVSFPPPAKQHPWLVVGLGNPGKKYDGTRHNVGFEMIDAIAEAEGITLSTVQHKALTGKGKIGSAQVLLAKPQTYVNLSGESVGPLAAYYRIPIQQILVIFDDMDLEFAVMRLLPKGGHGGHNGMKSLIQHLKGSRDFPRLRIGIGRPPGRMDPAAFVLQKFNKSEREEMDVSIARGIDAVRQVTTEGIEKAFRCKAFVRSCAFQKSPKVGLALFARSGASSFYNARIYLQLLSYRSFCNTKDLGRPKH